MTLALIAFAAFCATIAGGLVALRFKDKLHLILGFSAGAVIGVAFFDLLPEAIELGGSSYSPRIICATVVLGFVVYMILDRLMIMHGHGHHAEHEQRGTGRRGLLGAGS